MQTPAPENLPTDPGQPIALHLDIRGRVQGVGYRASMQTRARELQVHGWVRNRGNGGVEAWVQGPRPMVEALVAWCHDGPALARVSAVVAEPAVVDSQTTDFRCRETVA